MSTATRVGITRDITKIVNGQLLQDAVWLPIHSDALVWDLELTNLAGEDEEVDVFAYAELSQYNWLDEMTFG